MTILDELADLAFKQCENGRNAGQKHHSRGASLLAAGGKVYNGCDMYIREGDQNSVSAERAAIIAAVSDGVQKFEVIIYTYQKIMNNLYFIFLI
jgi:cytidine deaminase